jgi:peptide-methionine (R)-S-oxide reductase
VSVDRILKTDAQWQQQLSAEQYRVLRNKGTERAFSGSYGQTKEPGTYRCAGCDLPLFTAGAKFDSSSGWPSFTATVNEDHVELRRDGTLAMVRVEVLCARCGGHLGHVFDDGPAPTGQRFCINSVCLRHEPEG